MIKKPGSQSEVHHSEDGVSRDGRLREVHAGLFPVSLSDDPMGGCKLNATHPTRRLRLTDFPALKVELQDWKHKLITLWREPTDRVPLVAVPAHTRVEVGESSSGCKLNATQDLLAG